MNVSMENELKFLLWITKILSLSFQPSTIYDIKTVEKKSKEFWKYDKKIKMLKNIFYFLDEEYGERSVSVNLDGVESELNFIDHTAEEMSVRNSRLLSIYLLLLLQLFAVIPWEERKQESKSLFFCCFACSNPLK